MEQIYGVDVSWMTHGNPKDKATRIASRQRSLSQQAHDPPLPTSVSSVPDDGSHPKHPLTDASSSSRPETARSRSGEKRPPLSQSAPPLQRRSSWFSNLSAKFSSSGHATGQSPSQTNNAPSTPAEMPVPKTNPARNAILQHATKYEGDEPYTPAPPRTSQTGIMHVFRRLSSNGNLAPASKRNAHGLVERRVLNVDQHRERCDISGLHQAKLRRVAFCVDVEIAPMPKYSDSEVKSKKITPSHDKTTKRKITEKGEGEALKSSRTAECQTAEAGEKKKLDGKTDLKWSKEEENKAGQNGTGRSAGTEHSVVTADKTGSEAKKKEKKKKSEEERKARKEKKRKQAEANGTIPMEIHPDSDSSTDVVLSSPVPGTAKAPAQFVPTTNPARIYRRCCQLRETPILKKITEQLTNATNCSTRPGMVDRLDLTGYWMQLSDLIALGDYLAVVPVKELIMENCGLTDEGLRVILAGLLAAREPEARRRKAADKGLTQQGGAVERLVLRNNKIGPEGWKHICLFVYLCRTLQCLDLSKVQFPQETAADPNVSVNGIHGNGSRMPLDTCGLFVKALKERLGGSTLGLLNMSETGLSTSQLGLLMDAVIKSGIRKLGLAHNNIDPKGIEYVVRFLGYDGCDGLDLGGNDLRDQLGVIADAIPEGHRIQGLSLAECNLVPWSLCKLLPKLVKLGTFKFLDLSHNPELFTSQPSAVPVLRRYLPKFPHLKRIHLADCALSSPQAIALAEIIPEIRELAHINLLENPELKELTEAKTEEKQEEACALFASLLAAARISTSLVAVDIEVPSEQCGELVKAMAKQVIAYCLRNMERLSVSEPAAATTAQIQVPLEATAYPDVLQHLVGKDGAAPDSDAEYDAAPNDDYVIGGTGVVKALACCLENRGVESRRQSIDFIRDVENGVMQPKSRMPSGKAKETSKHLLSSARKIRHRLQPVLQKARAAPGEDPQAYHRLLFLNSTLEGIIKRFEDEFPDTREGLNSAGGALSSDSGSEQHLGTSVSSAEVESELFPASLSDAEDEENGGRLDLGIRPAGAPASASLARSDSSLSMTSRKLTHEEGEVFRAGQHFRAGILRPEHYMLLSRGLEMVKSSPQHVRMLHELLDELGDEGLLREARQKSIDSVFREHRDEIIEKMRAADPAHWDRFTESQVMASANTRADNDEIKGAVAPPSRPPPLPPKMVGPGEEGAVVDE